MDEQHKLIVAPEDSPTRCKDGNASGQCKYEAYPGLKFCPRHMGRSHHEQRKNELKNYVLTKFRTEVENKVYSGRHKSLIEEVALLRHTLQLVWNNCQTEFDVVLYQSKIVETVRAISSTLESCQKLEERANLTMDKAQLTVICRRLIEVTNKYVSPEQMPDMAEEILKAFEDPTTPTDNS